MRYLCHFAFSYAVAALLCAYSLPEGWLMPLMAAALLAGLCCWLGYRLRRQRFLMRATLCLLGAALCFGLYRVHILRDLAPARSLDGQTVSAVAELREYPGATAYGSSALAWLEYDGQRQSVLCYLDADADYRAGDRLSGSFALKLPSDEADNAEPGYLRSCGVYLTVNPKGDVSLERPEKLPLRYWSAAIRHLIQNACREMFSERTAPWYLALLTNENSELSYASKNELKLAGILHCICTSGMHITVLLSLVSALCLGHRRLAAMLGIPVCVFFWAVAGGTPSVSRAVVMQGFLLLAPLLLREQDTLSSMAAALLLILLRRPDCIAHLGLQLSFLSVAGISLCSSRLYRWFMARRPIEWLNRHLPRLRRNTGPHWLLHLLFSSLSTSLGALLFTTPLLAWQNGLIALLSPIAGLLTLSVVTVCFALGLPAICLTLLLPQAGAVFAFPLEWLMRYVIRVTELCASAPGSALYMSSPYMGIWLGSSYLLLALVFLDRKRPLIPVLCIVISLLAALGIHQLEQHLRQPKGSFQLTALDVGQGQCLILRSDERVCVIDCGGSWPEDAGEQCARFLLGQGIRQIDLLVLTHFHSDHAGGAAQLLSRVPAALLCLPEIEDGTETKQAILEAADNSEIHWITEDSALSFGSGRITLFAPRSSAGSNEACLCVLASFGEDDLLVTGDIDQGTEILLCKSADLPDIEVFVASHHGSRDSNSELLLQRTAPDLVIISCEAGNRYGHPHSEALERFAAVGAKVLRTDESGTITIER